MWLTFALISALLNTVSTLARRIKGRNSQALVVGWWVSVLVIPMTAALSFALGGISEIDSGFWVPMILSAIVTAFATVAVIRAYQLSDMSLVVPLKNVLPAFLLISSFFYARRAAESSWRDWCDSYICWRVLYK